MANLPPYLRHCGEYSQEEDSEEHPIDVEIVQDNPRSHFSFLERRMMEEVFSLDELLPSLLSPSRQQQRQQLEESSSTSPPAAAASTSVAFLPRDPSHLLLLEEARWNSTPSSLGIAPPQRQPSQQGGGGENNPLKIDAAPVLLRRRSAWDSPQQRQNEPDGLANEFGETADDQKKPPSSSLAAAPQHLQDIFLKAEEEEASAPKGDIKSGPGPPASDEETRVRLPPRFRKPTPDDHLHPHDLPPPLLARPVEKHDDANTNDAAPRPPRYQASP